MNAVCPSLRFIFPISQNYTNPDVLRFAWIPGPKIHNIVDPVAHSIVKKNQEQHTEKLQVSLHVRNTWICVSTL